MKLVRLSTILDNVKTRFGVGNAAGFSSYSAATRTPTRNPGIILWKGSMYGLYRRISPIGNPTVSVIPLLDQWVEEGRPVDKKQLQIIIKGLRSYKRFTHALEVSMWLTDKRYFPLTVADTAIRLDLIAKVKGIEQAEHYFSNVPKQLRSLEVYTALLNCYAYVQYVEKAEAIFQTMRDLGLARTTLAYNSMLKLYYQSGNYEKLDSLMHEMEEKGIDYDRYTFGIRLSAYAAASDSQGMDKTLTMMESYPNLSLEWTVYATAASGYAEVGLLDKAFAMLKKAEGLIIGKRVSGAYEFLLTQYAKYGNKDETLRIWELYKKRVKVYNKGYICILTSMLKLDDLENAEKIFEEWESQNLHYDIRIPNFMIDAYSRKGLMQKAETLVNQAKLKVGKLHLKTWYFLVTGYLQNNETQKAVDAMKEALTLYQPPSKWKPSLESLAGCLDYFKDERDKEGAEDFIKLLKDRDVIPAEFQDRLLNNVEEGKSNLDTLKELYSNSFAGNEEALSGSEDDSGDTIKEEKTHPKLGFGKLLKLF